MAELVRKKRKIDGLDQLMEVQLDEEVDFEDDRYDDDTIIETVEDSVERDPQVEEPRTQPKTCKSSLQSHMSRGLGQGISLIMSRVGAAMEESKLGNSLLKQKNNKLQARLTKKESQINRMKDLLAEATKNLVEAKANIEMTNEKNALVESESKAMILNLNKENLLLQEETRAKILTFNAKKIALVDKSKSSILALNEEKLRLTEEAKASMIATNKEKLALQAQLIIKEECITKMKELVSESATKFKNLKLKEDENIKQIQTEWKRIKDKEVAINKQLSEVVKKEPEAKLESSDYKKETKLIWSASGKVKLQESYSLHEIVELDDNASPKTLKPISGLSKVKDGRNQIIPPKVVNIEAKIDQHTCKDTITQTKIEENRNDGSQTDAFSSTIVDSQTRNIYFKNVESQTETVLRSVESQTEVISYNNVESQTEKISCNNVESQTEKISCNNVESQTDTISYKNIKSQTEEPANKNKISQTDRPKSKGTQIVPEKSKTTGSQVDGDPEPAVYNTESQTDPSLKIINTRTDSAPDTTYLEPFKDNIIPKSMDKILAYKGITLTKSFNGVKLNDQTNPNNDPKVTTLGEEIIKDIFEHLEKAEPEIEEVEFAPVACSSSSSNIPTTQFIEDKDDISTEYVKHTNKHLPLAHYKGPSKSWRNTQSTNFTYVDPAISFSSPTVTQQTRLEIEEDVIVVDLEDDEAQDKQDTPEEDGEQGREDTLEQYNKDDDEHNSEADSEKDVLLGYFRQEALNDETAAEETMELMDNFMEGAGAEVIMKDTQTKALVEEILRDNNMAALVDDIMKEQHVDGEANQDAIKSNTEETLAENGKRSANVLVECSRCYGTFLLTEEKEHGLTCHDGGEDEVEVEEVEMLEEEEEVQYLLKDNKKLERREVEEQRKKEKFKGIREIEEEDEEMDMVQEIMEKFEWDTSEEMPARVEIKDEEVIEIDLFEAVEEVFEVDEEVVIAQAQTPSKVWHGKRVTEYTKEDGLVVSLMEKTKMGWKCKPCGKEKSRPDIIKRHIETDHQNKGINITNRGQGLTSPDYKDKMELTESGWKCKICGVVWYVNSSTEKMKLHIDSVHGEEEKVFNVEKKQETSIQSKEVEKEATKKQSGVKDVDVDDAVNCPVCEVELEAKDGPSLVRHVAACNQKRFGTRRRGLRNR